MEFRRLSAGFGAEAERIPADFGAVWDLFFASQVLVFTSSAAPI